MVPYSKSVYGRDEQMLPTKWDVACQIVRAYRSPYRQMTATKWVIAKWDVAAK